MTSLKPAIAVHAGTGGRAVLFIVVSAEFDAPGKRRVIGFTAQSTLAPEARTAWPQRSALVAMKRANDSGVVAATG